MRWIAALLVLLASAQTVPAAELTADRFRNVIQGKVAPPFGTIGDGKWKALCVCNPNDLVGAIETFNGIPNLGVTCTVPRFNPDGTYAGAGACYDWTPMAK